MSKEEIDKFQENSKPISIKVNEIKTKNDESPTDKLIATFPIFAAKDHKELVFLLIYLLN